MEWIVFDLDGTLIESEQIWRDVRREFVTENGGHWRDDAQATMMGMRTDEWARYMRDELGVDLPVPEIRDRVVKGVIARLSQRVPILPGARDALERLSAGFLLGVATSSASAVARSVLRRTGWERYFAAVVSADSVPHGKPAPDVYLRAVELLRADPVRTAAVEDSANGIRSASAAGLAVIAIPNRDFPPDAQTLALATRIEDLGRLNVATIREALRNRANVP